LTERLQEAGVDRHTRGMQGASELKGISIAARHYVVDVETGYFHLQFKRR
jgi:hypothetical protein